MFHGPSSVLHALTPSASYLVFFSQDFNSSLPPDVSTWTHRHIVHAAERARVTSPILLHVDIRKLLGSLDELHEVAWEYAKGAAFVLSTPPTTLALFNDLDYGA
jgi:hypothetical protein